MGIPHYNTNTYTMLKVDKEIRDLEKFEQLMKAKNAFDKVAKSIDSCNKQSELKGAKNMVLNFEKMFHKSIHLEEKIQIRAMMITMSN